MNRTKTLTVTRTPPWLVQDTNNRENDAITEIEENYSEELWFPEIDEKVFCFIYKAHNWLREAENNSKKKGYSKSSDSVSKLSCSSGLSWSRSSRISAKEKVCKKYWWELELEQKPLSSRRGGELSCKQNHSSLKKKREKPRKKWKSMNKGQLKSSLPQGRQ